MGLQELMMKAAAKMADLAFDKKLSAIKDEAREQGYQVTFEGEYQQAPAGQPSIKIRVPFVVAQDEQQRARLSGGFLEGRVYELGRYAIISGKIEESAVRFGKIYDENSVDDPEHLRKGIEIIQGILAAAGEPSTVQYDHLVNPHVIAYEGKRTSTPDGLSYSGNWHFKSDNADMEQEGPFSMRATHPLAMNLFSRS